MANGNTLIEGKDFDEPVILRDEDVKEQNVSIISSVYPLRRWEFNILKDAYYGWKEWASKLFFIWIGSVLIILSKIVSFIYEFYNTNSPGDLKLGIENFEILYVVSLLVLMGVFNILGKVWKSDREKLIEKISESFGPKL
jgi:hypothetical protein